MEESTVTTPIQQLLTPLRESIVDKPPYMSGTFPLPNAFLSLFYKTSGDDARYINLATATHDELEQLTQACVPASFGLKEKEVLDETYRKAGKMDTERFAPLLNLAQIVDLTEIVRGYLLEGTQSTEPIVAELHKLNVYSTGSFFRPHVDTPRSEKMFGSLVIVFPTPHEGGALFLRHRGHEWVFDSGRELAAKRDCIGYVAFFSDVEHEVAPVISGHRVTLTYNLYFKDKGGPISSKSEDVVSKPLSPPQPVNENAFRETFEALLENPEFLADGGTLAFGMRHAYPISCGPDQPNSLEPIYGALKGSDAVVYQTALALGFQPVLYMYYQFPGWNNDSTSAVIDKVIDASEEGFYQEVDLASLVAHEGGVEVCQEGQTQEDWDHDVHHAERTERVEWVTPVTKFNSHRSTFGTYGNEPSLQVAYADLCMFVRIGKAGERLAYPSVSQLKKEWERRRESQRGW